MTPFEAAVQAFCARPNKQSIVAFTMNPIDINAFMKQPWTDHGLGRRVTVIRANTAPIPMKYQSYREESTSSSMGAFIHQSTGSFAADIYRLDRIAAT